MIDYQTPIRRKLEACHAASEAWKVNHQEAARVFVLEDVLGDLIECGETLDRLEQAVIGELTANPDNDRGDLAELVQALRKLLLAVCESVSEAAAGFVGQYDVQRYRKFQEVHQRALAARDQDFLPMMQRQVELLSREVAADRGFPVGD